MKTIEALDAFREMEIRMRGAVEGLEKAKKEAEDNLNGVYWTSVKMENNSQKFRQDERDRTDNLQKELNELITYYEEMIQSETEVMNDFGSIADQLANDGREEIVSLQEEYNVGRVFDKVNRCTAKGQLCLEKQKGILAEADLLENSLRGRANAGNLLAMCNMLKDKIKGRVMTEQQ